MDLHNLPALLEERSQNLTQSVNEKKLLLASIQKRMEKYGDLFESINVDGAVSKIVLSEFAEKEVAQLKADGMELRVHLLQQKNTLHHLRGEEARLVKNNQAIRMHNENQAKRRNEMIKEFETTSSKFRNAMKDRPNLLKQTFQELETKKKELLCAKKQLLTTLEALKARRHVIQANIESLNAQNVTKQLAELEAKIDDLSTELAETSQNNHRITTTRVKKNPQNDEEETIDDGELGELGETLQALKAKKHELKRKELNFLSSFNDGHSEDEKPNKKTKVAESPYPSLSEYPQELSGEISVDENKMELDIYEAYLLNARE